MPVPVALLFWESPGASHGSLRRTHGAGTEPRRHVGQQGGTAAGFGRYSEVLQRSEIVWNGKALNAWLRNPAALIPNNTMLFRGIQDRGTREILQA